ncbi:MAG: class I SAM-dependent methyltransferase, partial [Phycisphaerales bacterium]|nr:class I SAM-dependent methyltransferase [Phycisphaerales bacterium]
MLGWRDSATWIELTNDSALSASLLEAIAAAPEESPALIARLRKQFAPELVAAALELCAARKKAAGKLATTGVLCADREGVEMASSTRAARWKAQRFARARGEHQRVLDLFCGIGADLSALVDVCGESMVIGVENDPLRAWMACGNAEGRVREADVRSEAIQSLLPNALIHCDPPRRDHRGRAWKRGEETIEEFDLATMLSWMRAAQGGALKLGPGVARELIVSADAECEYIEVDGTMEQCVVWTGALATAPGTCRATRIAGETITRCGVPRTVPQADELSAYLFEPCA